MLRENSPHHAKKRKRRPKKFLLIFGNTARAPAYSINRKKLIAMIALRRLIKVFQQAKTKRLWQP
jgi:hypothetical protein